MRIPEKAEAAADHRPFPPGPPGEPEAGGEGTHVRIESAVRAARIAGAEITEWSVRKARGLHAGAEALHPAQVVVEGKLRIPAQPEVQGEIGGGAEVVLDEEAPARSRKGT